MPPQSPPHAQPSRIPEPGAARAVIRLRRALRAVLLSCLLGLCLPLTGTADALADELFDHIPGAKQVFFLKNFATQRVDRTNDAIVVKGVLNAKQVNVVQTFAHQNATFEILPGTASGITLADLVPELRDFPGTEAFALDKLEVDEQGLAATGTVNVRGVDFTASLDLKAKRLDVAATGSQAGAKAGIGLLIPALKDAPVVSDFTFARATFDLVAKTFSATSALNQAAMTATIDASGGARNLVLDLKASSTPVTLGDAVPDLQGLPMLKDFTLSDLSYTFGTKTAATTISFNRAELTGSVTAGKGPKGLVFDLKTSTGSIGLKDVLPDLANAPVVNDFTFETLRCDLAAKTLTLAGALNAAGMTATLDASKGAKNLTLDLKATAGTVTPGQAIPDLQDVPALNAFGLVDLGCTLGSKTLFAILAHNAVEMTGSIDASKGVKSLVLDLKAATGAIGLKDVLPDLADAPVVNDFTFSELRFDLGARTLALTGTLNDAQMTATVATAKGQRSIDFAATTGKVTLVQVFPALTDIPLLDAFGLENLHCDLSTKAVSARVSLNEAEMTGTVDAGQGVQHLGFSLTASKGSVTLGEALPVLAQAPGVKAFALEGLFLKDNAFTADVSFSKAHASLTLKRKTSPAGGKGLDLDLTPVQGAVFDLASLFPDLASLPGISDFKLVDLNFDELAKQLTASLNIGGILATLSTDSEKTGGKTGRVFTLTSPNLGLGSIVSSLKGLPVLGDLKFTELSIGPGFIEATVDFAGSTVTLVENLAKGFAAMDFGSLDVASVVPSLKSTVIADLKMASSLFLVMKNAGKVSADDFPEDRRNLLADFDFSKTLNAGVNLLASINPSDLGKLAGPLKRLGLGAAKLPLNGSLPKGIFAFVEHAFKNKGQDPPPSLGASSLLKGITITVPVGAPKIAAISRFATLDPAVLYVSGDLGAGSPWAALPKELLKYKPTGDVDIALQGGITLSIGSFKEDMVALVDLNVGEKAGALSLLALDKGSWKDPFGIKGLTVKDGGYVVSLSDGPSGERADLSFFGTAKLHDKDDLAVSAIFQEKGGLPTLEYFEIAGPVTLADVASSIKDGKGCILRDLKVYPSGIEAAAEFKSGGFDGKFALYLFDVTVGGKSTLAAALDLNTDLTTKTRKNFSLGTLAKIAPLKGDKARFIAAKLDTMEVANACLVLSSQALPVVTLADLNEGPARDLFTRIFGKTKAPVRLDNVTLLSDFSTDMMGEIGDKLGKGAGGLKLGLDGGAVLNGAVGGLFDGDPLSLDLEVLVDGGFSLSNLQKAGLKLPKFLKAKPDSVGGGAKAGLILKVLDETCEVGLLGGFDVELGKTTFDFTGTLGVQLAEEDIGLSLTGSMADTWKDALGIKGFAIEKVVVTGEVEEEAGDPSLKLGLAGETNILGRDFTLAGDASLGLGPGVPIPDGLAMLAAASQLDALAYKIIIFMEAGSLTVGLAAIVPGGIALIPVCAVAGSLAAASIMNEFLVDAATHKKITAKDLLSTPGKRLDQFCDKVAWLMGAKELQMSFATPGASDVNLGIPDGIHLSGKIELFGGAIKTPTLHIPLSWVYKVAQAVSKAASQPAGPPQPEPMMMGAAPGPRMTAAAQPSSASLAATAQSYQLLRRIVAKELGLSTEDPGVAYPKPTAQELQELKAALHFTVGDSFHLGGVDFAGADVTLMPFKVKSRAKLFGAEQDVEISIKNGSLALEATSKLADICEADLVLEYDQEKEDFVLSADLKNNPALQKWLGNEIQVGVREISASATEKFDAVNKALAGAQKVRDAAAKALDDAQKAATSVTRDAVARLQSTTDTYKQDYQYAQSQYDACSGWKTYYCKTKWYPRKGLAWDTWQASLELLQDAQKALAEEKSLEVEVHSAQIKFTSAANTVALALKDVAAAGEIKDIIGQGLDAFARDAGRVGQAFALQEAYLVGSLGELRKGMPLVMEVYFTVDGKKYREYFAVSPTTPSFNALSFGLLPVIVAEHIVQDLETSLAKELAPKWGPLQGGVSAQFSTWVQAHIYELVGGLRENMEKQIDNIQYELTQEESKFKKVFDSLEAHAGTFLPGYTNLAKQADQILATYKMTDFMPTSSTFTNSYIAVGHSALCLGVASNGVDVYQQNCKDMDTEQWTATTIKDADGNDTGYVQMKSKGLCLKAKNLDAASGQPLALAQCASQDDHEKWKVVTQDGFYDKIINRYSQKCLHFDTENANDKAGYAVWTSCFGADSEAFRAIADAEKPTFYRVNAMLKAGSGTCLSTSDFFEKYFSKTARGQATSTREDFRKMQANRHNLLSAGACDGQAQDRFNYVEKPNGDVKIVHADSGWCATVDPAHNDALVLAPCDNGDDMYWRTKNSRGDAFELLNLDRNKCMNLEPANGRAGARGSDGSARLQPCQAAPSQFIDFIRK